MTVQKEQQKTWTQDQQIQYELARDVLSSLSAILSRYQTRITDEKEKKLFFDRSVEISQEKSHFNGFDDEIVKTVIDTYSPLIKEYNDNWVSTEHLIKNGLDHKYITTKVNYDAPRS
jgi:hypothetical protein